MDPQQPSMPTPSGTESNMPTHRSSTFLLVCVGIGMFILGLGTGYYLWGIHKQNNTSEESKKLSISPTQPVTSQEAKIYVGSGFSVKYPNNMIATQEATITSQDYPDGIETVDFTDQTNHIKISKGRKPTGIVLSTALGNGPGAQYTADFLDGKTTKNYTIDGVPGMGVSMIDVGQTPIILDVVWINGEDIYEAVTHTDNGAYILEKLLETITVQ